jgi:hypothetical protein
MFFWVVMEACEQLYGGSSAAVPRRQQTKNPAMADGMDGWDEMAGREGGNEAKSNPHAQGWDGWDGMGWDGRGMGLVGASMIRGKLSEISLFLICSSSARLHLLYSGRAKK